MALLLHKGIECIVMLALLLESENKLLLREKSVNGVENKHQVEDRASKDIDHTKKALWTETGKMPRVQFLYQVH